MCEVPDVTKIVKKPDVESGVSPETKPLKKVKKIILKKVILCGCFKPGCRHLLFLKMLQMEKSLFHVPA